METPEHISRIIERMEPVDQVAMEFHLADLWGKNERLKTFIRETRFDLSTKRVLEAERLLEEAK